MPVRGGIDQRLEETLAWLRRRGPKRNRDGMARYGIVTDKAFGVSMAVMEPLARRLRPDHRLALALWETGWHDARMLATMDPTRRWVGKDALRDLARYAVRRRF